MLDEKTLDIIHNCDDTTDVDNAVKNLLASSPDNVKDVDMILDHIDELRRVIKTLSHNF